MYTGFWSIERSVQKGFTVLIFFFSIFLDLGEINNIVCNYVYIDMVSDFFLPSL